MHLEAIMAEGERTGGSGGIYAMLIVVVVLILAVALYFSGMIGNRGGEDMNVDVDIETPSVPDGGGADGN